MALLQPLPWCCVDCMIHHERDVREEQKYMYVARTSNNRVISSGDLYWCLLPRCEALRTCRSGFPIATALKHLQALMDGGGISVCHPLLRAMIEGIEARFSAQFVDLDCILASDFYPHFKLVWVECLDDLKYDTKEITRKARSAMVSVLEDQNANLDSTSGSSDGDDSAADDFFSSLYRKSEKEKILHQSWFKIFLMKIQNAKLRSVKIASQLSSFSSYSSNSTPQSLRAPLWNDFSHW